MACEEVRLRKCVQRVGEPGWGRLGGLTLNGIVEDGDRLVVSSASLQHFAESYGGLECSRVGRTGGSPDGLQAVANKMLRFIQFRLVDAQERQRYGAVAGFRTLRSEELDTPIARELHQGIGLIEFAKSLIESAEGAIQLSLDRGFGIERARFLDAAVEER